MSDSEIWRLSATETAARTRTGDISAEAAVASSIARMDAVNPALNAVVQDLREEAQERARGLDQARAAGQPCGPLHGVPVTIKINVDQKGHASSNGVVALKDLIAPDDAPLVRHLQAAGAVVIGRTNVPEFSMRADTDNPLFGRTHNPWTRAISAGGSSGGAGVAAATGMCALAHGNDIGGSLRFPAAASGAVTVKPGLGRVAAYNPSQKEERGFLAQSMSVQGLITRSAEDLHLAMPTMIAPDPRDPYHVPLPWRGAALEGPIKIGFTKESYEFDLHPEVSAALDTARDALSDAGYIVEQIDPPGLREAARTGGHALASELFDLVRPAVQEMGSEAIRDAFDNRDALFPALERPEMLRAMAMRSHFAREWSLLLDRYPLVLSPFMLQPFYAPDRDREGVDGYRDVIGSAVWSTAMNFLGLPAANVPARLADLPNGQQPIGVQIIARRWREDLAVDACAAIEARIGRMSERLWQKMDG